MTEKNHTCKFLISSIEISAIGRTTWLSSRAILKACSISCTELNSTLFLELTLNKFKKSSTSSHEFEKTNSFICEDNFHDLPSRFPGKLISFSLPLSVPISVVNLSKISVTFLSMCTEIPISQHGRQRPFVISAIFHNETKNPKIVTRHFYWENL